MESRRAELLQYTASALTIERALAGLGLTLIATISVRLLSFLWLYFIRPSSLLRYRAPNAYALVTGASDGIGRSLAHELTARGFNVVLHGRNPAKLKLVQDSLSSYANGNQKVKIVVADAANSASLQDAINRVAGELCDRLDGPLTVLIHNCGGTQPLSGGFVALGDQSPTEIDSVLNLNARFHVQLTRALLPLLLGNEGVSYNNRSAQQALIMYISSLTGVEPVPLLSTYAPSKALGNTFMVALGREFRFIKAPVDTLSVIVGRVTETAYVKDKPDVFAPSAQTMAKAALDRVGCGYFSVAGYWAHAVQLSFLSWIPEPLRSSVVNSAMKNLLDAENTMLGDKHQ